MTEMELPIFNPEFLEKLKSIQEVPDHFLIFTEGYSNNEIAKKNCNRYKKYINAAKKVGLFRSDESKDIKKRLESYKDDQHFPALGHCKAAFFFSEMCCFDVKPVPPSQRKGKKLDLKIIYNDKEYFVEVKTPIIRIDWNNVPIKNKKKTSKKPEDVDIIEKLQKEIRNANNQFDDTSSNILLLETSCLTDKTDKYICSKAFFGQQAVTFKRSKVTGEILGQGSEFLADGILVNPKDPKGRYIKNGDIPFTRTGAVICFQDYLTEDKPYIIVIHNPYAINPISIELFKEYEQLVKTECNNDSFKMEWI